MDFDRERTAVLFIDFQVDVCAAGGLMVSQDADVLARFQAARSRAGAMLDAVRKYGGPQPVFIRHAFSAGYPELDGVRTVAMEEYVKSKRAFADGSPGAEWVPELQPLAGETVFTKTTISAFAGTLLDRWLRRRGIDTVMIGGVVTHYAVWAATLAAYDLGYRAIVLSDACASADPARHEMDLDNLEPLAEVVETGSVISALSA
jgi:nicotinamidase-related amidase